jgi:hypothetical protein
MMNRRAAHNQTMFCLSSDVRYSPQSAFSLLPTAAMTDVLAVIAAVLHAHRSLLSTSLSLTQVDLEEL